jgi:hypothetical protein
VNKRVLKGEASGVSLDVFTLDDFRDSFDYVVPGPMGAATAKIDWKKNEKGYFYTLTDSKSVIELPRVKKVVVKLKDGSTETFISDEGDYLGWSISEDGYLEVVRHKQESFRLTLAQFPPGWVSVRYG